MPRRVSNPPNPWASTEVEWLEEPPEVALEVFEERARTILATNDSPDVPFTWSLNPYRGCQHACAYCYARASHNYLGYGAGTDFDSKIVVKVNAPELLERELARRAWKGEWIAFSGVTDPYQPLEASYRLTRRCIEVCARRSNALGIITKGALVRRDVDLLAPLSRRGLASVYLSIPFADARDARAMEPFAPAPDKRFETLRALSEAGVSTGVAIAPLIPGLNDHALAEILRRAREAGAQRAFMVLLRLSSEVRTVFEERLHAAFPQRAKKVLSALSQMRPRGAAESSFGTRFQGAGPRWEAVRGLFDVTCRRLGFREHRREGSEIPMGPVQRRPAQHSLFDAPPRHP